MSSNLIKQELDESTVNGFPQYTLTEVYQLTVPRTSGPVNSLSLAGVPQRNSSKLVEGVKVWLRNRKLVIPNPKDAASDRFVNCTWTNNTQSFSRDSSGDPVDTPDEVVDRVEVTFANHREPVTDALFLGMTWGVPKGHSSNPPFLAAPGWLLANRVGAVTNSAGKPVLVEREVSTDQITVYRTARTWNNSWEDYKNAINSDTVTITQSDVDGVRLTKTYPPYHLKIEAILKNDIWRDGKLYFEAGFQMIENPRSWIHSTVDRGTERRAFVGQSKPEGGTYTQQEIDDLEISGGFGFTSILTDNGRVAISEPIKFNGTGAEMPLGRLDSASYDDDGEIFMNHLINPVIAFTPLLNPS